MTDNHGSKPIAESCLDLRVWHTPVLFLRILVEETVSEDRSKGRVLFHGSAPVDEETTLFWTSVWGTSVWDVTTAHPPQSSTVLETHGAWLSPSSTISLAWRWAGLGLCDIVG